MQLSDVNLLDLDVFEERVPHDMFEVLRREAPVFRHDEPEGSGFWAITKHEDLKFASKHPEIFSSERMGTMIQDPDPESLAGLRAIMLNMDPPRHRTYRAIVNKAFTPRMVESLRQRVGSMVERILDRAVEKEAEQGHCDFVDDIAAPLPMEVICEMVGVPEEDRRRIYEVGNMMVGFDDPELQDGRTAEDLKSASAEMFMYASKVAERARVHPGDDLGTALLQAEVNGEHLSELDYNSFFMILAIAGNETTRTVTTNGMIALFENPEQREKLQNDFSLIPSAVEEILRYAPAVLNFRRTATRDVELRGVEIKAGDKLTLWYPSVNRDEDVFEDSQAFDITRNPNDHLAFGVGEHFCLGANLARMELREIFQGILSRFPNMELAGKPRRLRSNFINGVKEMPVRLNA